MKKKKPISLRAAMRRIALLEKKLLECSRIAAKAAEAAEIGELVIKTNQLAWYVAGVRDDRARGAL